MFQFGTMKPEPHHRNRNQSYQRAQQTLAAIRSIPAGGTAFDVREKLIESTGEKVSIGPVKSALWHLHDLGLVGWHDKNGVRWWIAETLPEGE